MSPMTYEAAKRKAAARDELNEIRNRLASDALMSGAERAAFHQRSLDLTKEMMALEPAAAPAREIPKLDLDPLTAVRELQALRSTKEYWSPKDDAEAERLHQRALALTAAAGAPFANIEISGDEVRDLMAARVAGQKAAAAAPQPPAPEQLIIFPES